MTQSLLSSVSIGDRFFATAVDTIIEAVAEVSGRMAFIDLLDLLDKPALITMDIVGIVPTDDEIEKLGLLPILPIDLELGDQIVAQPEDGGSLAIGRVTALSENLATVATHTGGTSIVRRDRSFVLQALPRNHVDLFKQGDAVVIINPLRNFVGSKGIIVNTIAVEGVRGDVARYDIDVDGGFVTLFGYELARPASEVEEVSVLGHTDIFDNPHHAQEAVTNNKPVGTLFTNDFLPAAVTNPSPSDASNPAAWCFSYEELKLLASGMHTDPELPNNLLGAALVEGRKIDHDILETVVKGIIPKGYHTLVGDPETYLKRVGTIAVEQAEAFTQLVQEGKFEEALNHSVERPKPVVEAFADIVGITVNQANKIVFGSEVNEKTQPETAEVPTEEIDNILGHLGEVFDSIFGEGAWSVTDVDGNPVAGTQPQQEEVAEPDFSDTFSVVADIFGVTRDDAKKALYEAAYGGKSVLDTFLTPVGNLPQVLGTLKEAVGVAQGDLRALQKSADDLFDFLDALNSDLTDLIGAHKKD